MTAIPDRRSIRGDAFWGTVERSAHILQVYRTETIFLDALVIASAPHLHELEKRLRQRWIDVDRAKWQKRYIPILAQETLQGLLVDGMPDEVQFLEVTRKLLSRARGDGRKVRAFVEMVPLLWAQGKTEASAQLEALWARLAKNEEFPFFCAYSHDNYERHAATPCADHSLLLPG
jgi:hypothetical protein